MAAGCRRGGLGRKVGVLREWRVGKRGGIDKDVAVGGDDLRDALEVDSRL